MPSERIMADMDPSRLQKIKEAKKVKAQKRKEAPKTSHVEIFLRKTHQDVSMDSRAIEKAQVISLNPPIGSADLAGSSTSKSEKTLLSKRVRSEGVGDVRRIF